MNKRMNKRNMIAFAILMQNGEGIKSKTLEYFTEKWNECANAFIPENYLDSKNRELFNEVLKNWGLK